MMYGHRREMRKENSAAMRYQRSILHDEIERKAAELWARGTLAGDRVRIYYQSPTGNFVFLTDIS